MNEKNRALYLVYNFLVFESILKNETKYRDYIVSSLFNAFKG